MQETTTNHQVTTEPDDTPGTAISGYDIWHEACGSWHTIPNEGRVYCADTGDTFEIDHDRETK